MSVRTQMLRAAAVALTLIHMAALGAQATLLQVSRTRDDSGGVVPFADDFKTPVPIIESLWLADADSDNLIAQISPGEVFDADTLPTTNLTVVALANAETESVKFGFNGILNYRIENHTPYALGGDNAGDFAPVPLSIGWHVVRARPFGANGASGASGDEVLLSFGIFPQRIEVDSPLDGHDANPGDGFCVSAPNGGIDDYLNRTSSRDAEPDDAQRAAADRLTVDSPDADGRQPLQLAGPCTLRAAIEEANARSGAQHIEVPKFPSDYGLSLGQLEITDDVTIEGINRPVIDANHDSRVFLIDHAGDVALENLEIINGDAGNTGRGGGVRIDGSTVEITNCEIRNSRGNFGGGVYTQDSDATIRRSMIADNTAGHPDSFGGSGATQRGGGISVVGGELWVERTTVIDNRAVRGGGLSIAGALTFVLNSSIIENEAVTIGGGMELLNGEGVPADVHMAWSTVARNTAGFSAADGDDKRSGGGVRIISGELFTANSIIADNTDAWSSNSEHYAPDCYSPDPGDFISLRGNLIGVLNDNCVMYDTHLDDLLPFDTYGASAAPFDAGLGAISYSPRPVVLLLSGSAAVNHGTGAPGVEFYGYCPDFDGKDDPRPADDALCDIGASERQ